VRDAACPLSTRGGGRGRRWRSPPGAPSGPHDTLRSICLAGGKAEHGTRHVASLECSTCRRSGAHRHQLLHRLEVPAALRMLRHAPQHSVAAAQRRVCESLEELLQHRARRLPAACCFSSGRPPFPRPRVQAPPPLPRTNRTSLVPPLVLSGHAASLTPYIPHQVGWLLAEARILTPSLRSRRPSQRAGAIGGCVRGRRWQGDWILTLCPSPLEVHQPPTIPRTVLRPLSARSGAHLDRRDARAGVPQLLHHQRREVRVRGRALRRGLQRAWRSKCAAARQCWTAVWQRMN